MLPIAPGPPRSSEGCDLAGVAVVVGDKISVTLEIEALKQS